MAASLASRNWLPGAAVLAAAMAFGALVAVQPLVATGLIGAVVLTVFAFAAPVTHLTLLLIATVIVPLSVQNDLSFGGGLDSPGVLMSDALLATGLVRAAAALLREPLDRRRLTAAGLVLAFLCVDVLQLAHGLAQGRAASDVAAEWRVLLAFGTVLVALPIVADTKGRARLFRSLLFLGLVLGLWGVIQWVFQISYGEAGDIGVRKGVRGTTSGTGQLQGGLYAFPVAVLLALAALVAGIFRAPIARLLLLVVLALNAACLVLTYERTFWVATVIASLFLFLKAGGSERLKVLLWAPVILIVAVAALTALAPGAITTAQERLLSLGQYSSDASVNYRLEESRLVLEEIDERPVTGSGLGATIFFGVPGTTVAPAPNRFSHNGYLWLAWKVGIPAALLLLWLLALAILWRTPPSTDPTLRAVILGSQASLLALAIATVTFPSVNALSITPLMGVLIAIAATRPRPGADPREAQPVLTLAERHTPDLAVSGSPSR